MMNIKSKFCRPFLLFGRANYFLQFDQQIIFNASSSSSSKAWLDRHVNDKFVKMAQYDGYRARSAYKLIEIDDKYKFLRPGLKVLDCGAAPGSWTQVVTQRILTNCHSSSSPQIPATATRTTNTNNNIYNSTTTTSKSKKQQQEKFGCNKDPSVVVALDKLIVQPIEGAIILSHCDFTTAETKRKILEAFGFVEDDPNSYPKIDVLLSDMAPNASGNHETDHRRILVLVYSALKLATEILRPNSINSTFLCKIWDGSETKRLSQDLKFLFKHVHVCKPDSSRDESSEIFLLARHFLGFSNKK